MYMVAPKRISDLYLVPVKLSKEIIYFTKRQVVSIFFGIPLIKVYLHTLNILIGVKSIHLFALS